MHNKEEDYTGFGGIDICNSKEVDNAIESLYKGLIDKNFKVLNLEGVNAKLWYEPSVVAFLTKEERAQSCKEQWNHASVIGMFLYLSRGSRPGGVTFTVIQCDGFTHCAKNQLKIAL